MSNTTLTPSQGAVRLSSNTVPQLGSGALAFAGVMPNFGWMITVPINGDNVTPALALTGAGPVLQELAPTTTGSIVFAGVAPSVNLMNAAVTPSTGSSIVGGVPPSLGTGLNEPNGAAMMLTGLAPVLTIPNVSISVAPGAIGLSGGAPSLTGQGRPSAGATAVIGAAPSLGLAIVSGTAQTGPLGLAGASPLLSLGIAPSSGKLTLTTIKFSIAPSAAALALTGVSPPLSGSVATAPNAAALTVASDLTVISLTVPAAPSANIVLGGYYPAQVTNFIATPNGASLTLSGNAPTNPLAHVIAPQTGAMQLGAASPPGIAFLGFNLFTPTAIAQLLGRAPIASISTVLTVGAGAVGMSSSAPSLVPGSSVAPTGATLSLVSAAAGAVQSAVQTPAFGVIASSSAAPTLAFGIAPPAGVLGFAATPATVNGKAQVVVSTASLVFSAVQPAQGIDAFIPAAQATYTGNAFPLTLTITPAPVALALTPLPPVLNQQGLPFPATGTVGVAGSKPQLGINARVPMGTLAIASALPIVDSLMTLIPSTGAALYGSDPGGVNNTGVILPPVGLLSFASDPQQMSRSGFVAPSQQSLNMTGAPPTVILTSVGLVTPPPATVALSGCPAVTPLYPADPYYRVALPAGLFVVTLPPGGQR